MTLWTVACQDPLSMGFYRQAQWSGFSFTFFRGSSQPGIELVSPTLAGGFFTAVCQESPMDKHIFKYKTLFLPRAIERSGLIHEKEAKFLMSRGSI